MIRVSWLGSSPNPMFLDSTGPDGLAGTDDDDLHLAAGSPGLDAGDNAAVSSTSDRDGNPRTQDSDGDATATVDMGAYEHEYVPLPVCFASRDLSLPRLAYEPSVTKTVHVMLLPDVDTTVLGVEDALPPGWIDVANISNGGSYDPVAHKVKWGPVLMKRWWPSSTAALRAL